MGNYCIIANVWRPVINAAFRASFIHWIHNLDLCLSVFPWADFRATKGAIKLHVGLNHSGYLREFAVITERNPVILKSDVRWHFQPAVLWQIDRGYMDYEWFKQLTNKGVHFVTRLILLIAFIKFKSTIQISMQQILRLLQLNLFEKRDLMGLLL
ncbi:MAG: hypothetical protein NMNS01_03540 [Nitrosomonas sp.]|nr:MAG: hypothetical protein NMNS01_03540 [Nitrosomonas sp.]